MKRKKGGSAITKSKSSSNPDRPVPPGQQHLRSKATINRIKVYRQQPIRDEKGKILKWEYQSKDVPTARILPNRKWYQPSRSSSQKQLETFREDLSNAVNNPFVVLLKQKQLPMSLITDNTKEGRVHLLETESFGDTFGPKRTRKRPKIEVASYEELANSAVKGEETYNEEKDRNIPQVMDFREAKRDEVFEKGTSKRIWNELYKVIDASDVIVQVLDARDPMGTRSPHIENYMKKDKKHKHLIFILNKCDLIPTWATARWVKVLSKEYPTLAFHASITNPFGKGSLIQLLRQYGRLHSDKKQISVGFIGYPNVGKSSIINTLRKKKVCKVAPIPGETKVWQYITLMRNIFLIDCPGVVYPSGDTETEILLKGVVRVENVKDCTEHIPMVLERVKKEYLVRTYHIESWEDHVDFLTQLAKKTGRLLKGGEPDLNMSARMLLYDWQRGKIPYFVCPPFENDGQVKDAEPDASDTLAAMNITQKFSNIPLSNKFDDEENATRSQQLREAEKNSTDVDWDDVFQSAQDENDEGENEDEDNENEQSFEDMINNDEDEEFVEDQDEDENGELEEEEEEESESEEEDAPPKPVPILSKTQKLKQKMKALKERKMAEAAEEEEEEESPIQSPQKNNNNKNKSPGKSPTKSPNNKKRRADEDSEEENKPKKEARMTTNKKKTGVHYYATANVKNKNRNRKIPKTEGKKRKIRHQTMRSMF